MELASFNYSGFFCARCCDVQHALKTANDSTISGINNEAIGYVLRCTSFYTALVFTQRQLHSTTVTDTTQLFSDWLFAIFQLALKFSAIDWRKYIIEHRLNRLH